MQIRRKILHYVNPKSEYFKVQSRSEIIYIILIFLLSSHSVDLRFIYHFPKSQMTDTMRKIRNYNTNTISQKVKFHQS